MTRIDRVPLVLLAIMTLCTIVMIPLSVGPEEAFDTVLYTFLPMSLAITGALIATREPANPIGRIFCALGGFSARLRNQVDLAALHGELTTAVRQTLAPTRVSLWLRPSDPTR